MIILLGQDTPLQKSVLMALALVMNKIIKKKKNNPHNSFISSGTPRTNFLYIQPLFSFNMQVIFISWRIDSLSTLSFWKFHLLTQ